MTQCFWTVELRWAIARLLSEGFRITKAEPPVQWVCEELTRGIGGAIETLFLYARTGKRVNSKT